MALPTPFYDEVHAFTHRPLSELTYPQSAERQMLQYRMWIRQARRFVISDSMSDLVVQASLRLDKMPLWIVLARIPFDVCWFEIDNHQHILSLQRHSTLGHPVNLDEVARKTGWLLVRDKPHPTRWFAFEFASLAPTEDDLIVGRRDRSDIVVPGLAAYVLDPDGHPGSPALGGLGIKPLSVEVPALPAYIEHVLWGINDPRGNVMAPEWALHRINAFMEPLLRTKYRHPFNRSKTYQMDRFIQTQMVENRGIMRFIVTLLAAVNDVPVLYKDVEARPGHAKTRLKKVPYLSHQVITIKAPKAKPVEWLIKKLDGAAGSRKKRHEVRGHWRVLINRKTRVVQGRTWIPSHQRGDASLGYVKHDYIIEPS